VLDREVEAALALQAAARGRAVEAHAASRRGGRPSRWRWQVVPEMKPHLPIGLKHLEAVAKCRSGASIAG